jgi:hypothetical protein
MRKLIITIAAFGGIAAGCPSVGRLQSELQTYIPGVKVLSVKKDGRLKGFCDVKISIKRGRMERIFTAYVDEDGKFFTPFVGEVKFKKTSYGFEKVEIRSLRHPDRTYTFGYLFKRNGKTYFVPMLLKLKGKEKLTPRSRAS